MIDPSWYILVSCLLFSLGLFGLVFSRRNFVVMLMAIEIMLLAANLLLASFSIYESIAQGKIVVEAQVFVLFSLTITAAEAAIGLAIFVVYFRQKTSIQADHPHAMRG